MLVLADGSEETDVAMSFDVFAPGELPRSDPMGDGPVMDSLLGEPAR